MSRYISKNFLNNLTRLPDPYDLVMSYYNDMVSILVNRVNGGKLDDVEVCNDIAAWIGMIGFGAPQIGLWSAIGEFINEHGEDVDETYMGRDADGEKQYHTFNPDTNWHTRIRRALVAGGYYDRYNEWAKEQKG